MWPVSVHFAVSVIELISVAANCQRKKRLCVQIHRVCVLHLYLIIFKLQEVLLQIGHVIVCSCLQ